MDRNFPLLNSDKQLILIEIFLLECNLCLDKLIVVSSHPLKDLSVTEQYSST